jgi:hypothetical protein
MTNKVTVDLNMLGTLMEDVIVGNLDGTTPRSLGSQRNQRSLAVVSANARYSASVLERVITDCFLLHQEMRESLRRKQYPIVERRSVGTSA